MINHSSYKQQQHRRHHPPTVAVPLNSFMSLCALPVLVTVRQHTSFSDPNSVLCVRSKSLTSPHVTACHVTSLHVYWYRQHKQQQQEQQNCHPHRTATAAAAATTAAAAAVPTIKAQQRHHLQVNVCWRAVERGAGHAVHNHHLQQQQQQHRNTGRRVMGLLLSTLFYSIQLLLFIVASCPLLCSALPTPPFTSSLAGTG